MFKFRDYTVKELSLRDAPDIYNVLASHYIDHSKHITMRQKDARAVNGRIRYVFANERYYAIGVYKGDELVGVVLCNDEDDIPWIGNAVVLDRYKHSYAVIALFYYILNIKWKDKKVQMGGEPDPAFKKLVTYVPVLKRGVFPQDTKDRIAKIIEKG